MYSTASFCNTPTALTNKQAKPNTLFVFYDEDCISRQTMFLHTTSAQPTHSPTEVTNNMARYPPLTATTWHHLVDAVSKKIEFLGPWCQPPPPPPNPGQTGHGRLAPQSRLTFHTFPTKYHNFYKCESLEFFFHLPLSIRVKSGTLDGAREVVFHTKFYSDWCINTGNHIIGQFCNFAGPLNPPTVPDQGQIQHFAPGPQSMLTCQI